ncbi:hypothetical protein I6N95_07900 [Vagococcus sp. BWB3-3]|uniref:Lipoprotein n=1 Tax=Vagococcus allomyrinae TaxID=2794353 RepID=A0A940P3M8_9ENTE|nr:hypothetical protein [Vagococcus allomyrinae]MBP1040924.1 hypothetical protein [Vagococcus allomyrinae]
MKKYISLTILILAFIGLSGCSPTENKDVSLKKETIRTLDSSKIYHDYLPDDNGTIDSNLPEVITPE